MVDNSGYFTWYELITTDVAAAKAFYTEVVGWRTQDASTADLSYTFFAAGKDSVGGLMDLPEEALKMGARPRWMGYVSVEDMAAVVARIKDLGGAIFVPPTNSNIGRISVVADPQMATLALVEGLKYGQRQLADPDRTGRVGWHELCAADWEKALSFYGEIFSWQKVGAEIGPSQTYQLFSAGGRTIGGMFNKNAVEPVPFWMYYFNVDDIDAAAARVKAAGGKVSEGPLELSGGIWIARCSDPQGAAFALQSMRGQDASEMTWTSEWSGISSRGRLISRPRG